MIMFIRIVINTMIMNTNIIVINICIMNNNIIIIISIYGMICVNNNSFYLFDYHCDLH